MENERVRGKVGVVGTGMVGSSFAYAMMQSGIANELVLIDRDAERAEGEAMDLNHGLPFVGAMHIQSGDYPDLVGAEVVVVTAGSNQSPGQTRLELLDRNAHVFEDIIPRIVAVNPGGLILVATNPVDILTQISAELSGLPWGQVLGSGTILDTARLRFLLGEHYDVNPRSISAQVVGEHGDSGLPLWSLATVGGIPLRDFTGPNGQGYDVPRLEGVFEAVRNAAYETIRRKQATYYAIGLGLQSIVKSILRNQKSVMTVSLPLRGSFGVQEIAASLPAVVGRSGVIQVLEPPMTPAEVKGFQDSAQLLRERHRSIRHN